METFDVVVVGGGPAGEVAAGRVADAGLAVALVEDDLVGGECSFYACMPSKALLRPEEALHEVRRIPGAAEAVTGELDVQAVLDRRDEIIHDLDDASQLPWLEDRGIKLYRGFGVLAGEKRVDVGEHELEARRAVILAGGSRAALPPIEGLGEAEPWTNREATTAKHVPGSVLILGGGVFGTELAQAYQSLGAQVTLIEGERRLLPTEEEFACADVTDALVERGVDVRTGR
jgi:pyruvate/2-oxoglutarate dehydrogenase complex dihydrolipoamide dehydrogenase (E3) component